MEETSIDASAKPIQAAQRLGSDPVYMAYHDNDRACREPGISMSQRLGGVREANRSLVLLSRHSFFRRAVCVNALVRICAGRALKACGIQSPEMEAAAKPSSQPRTKSCVGSGDGHCEA